MVAAPSLNVTVPVGVPPLPLTVAVKVTLCPKRLGLGDEVRLVVVDFIGATYLIVRVGGLAEPESGTFAVVVALNEDCSVNTFPEIASLATVM